MVPMEYGAMKCYRVWFEDGSALLVDASDTSQAKNLALILAKPQFDGTVAVIVQIELMD